MFNKFFSFFSHDIGIDLGTATTLVYVEQQGVVVNEPSVVAINQKTGQVVAVGHEAKNMLGRTPGHILAIRPLIEGVISDFEVTEEMLAFFIKKVHKDKNNFFARPRIVIGIPSGITEVERKAVRDAAINAGAREVYLVEEPMAAAIGIELPVQGPSGNMIVDIGGGTTDIAVISLGGIVSSVNLRVAGDKLNSDIINYLRDDFKMFIGERTAEDIKISTGIADLENQEILEINIRGRDVLTGLPREQKITSLDVQKAISKSVKILVDSIKEVIEDTPPELVSDIMQKGIFLVGGGAYLRGIDKLIERETNIPVFIDKDPLTAVVRGTGKILEDLESLKRVLMDQKDDEIILR